MPNKLFYEPGSRVELPGGFYNIGYADLSGYSVKVIDTRFAVMEDILADNGVTADYLDGISYLENSIYVYIVTAVFEYDGVGDPLNSVIDLSSFKLVGRDYYYDFSTELNELGGINPILGGNYMFSIGSGKAIEIELLFPIDTKSGHSVTLKYLIKTNPKVLISYYPDEIYLELVQPVDYPL
jgi:hypothetical protein